MVASEKCWVCLAGSLARSASSEWERMRGEFGMRLAVSRGWRDWPGEHHWNVSWVPAYTTADFCVCTTVHALPPAASDLLKKKVEEDAYTMLVTQRD